MTEIADCRPRPRKLRLAILGDADFRGRVLERAAKAAGHDARPLSREGLSREPGAIDVCADFGVQSAVDVREVLANARGRIAHYVLVSSYEVYPSGSRLRPWGEDEIDLTDEPGSKSLDPRTAGFRAAERELRLTGRRAIPWTILRPSLIEGARNPAGHSRWFVERLLERRPIRLPPGDLPLYRQVWIEDLARAVLAVAGREEAFFEQANVTGAGLATFETHARELGRALGVPAVVARVAGNGSEQPDRVPFAHGIDRSFMAASPRLARLGWAPTPPTRWLPHLARTLAKTLPPTVRAHVAPRALSMEQSP
jgi:nucleoside-diphosphate-sugar epimerase